MTCISFGYRMVTGNVRHFEHTSTVRVGSTKVATPNNPVEGLTLYTPIKEIGLDVVPH
jgi:hypothetical protein